MFFLLILYNQSMVVCTIIPEIKIKLDGCVGWLFLIKILFLALSNLFDYCFIYLYIQNNLLLRSNYSK